MDITLDFLLLGLGDDSGRQWKTHGLHRKLWFEGPATLPKMNPLLDEFFHLSEPWCLHPSVGITTSALRGEGSLSGSPHTALGTCSARARSYLSLWRAGVGPTQGCPVAEGIHLQAHPRCLDLWDLRFLMAPCTWNISLCLPLSEMNSGSISGVNCLTHVFQDEYEHQKCFSPSLPSPGPSVIWVIAPLRRIKKNKRLILILLFSLSPLPSLLSSSGLLSLGWRWGE